MNVYKTSYLLLFVFVAGCATVTPHPAKVEAPATRVEQQQAQNKLTIPEIIASPTTEIAEASVAPSATTSTLTSPIPLPSTSVEASPMTQLSPEASPVVTITGTSYTVKEGDTLWSIACQAYGDCYAWVKIAKSNNLINPDLIHPGNVFNLPR